MMGMAQLLPFIRGVLVRWDGTVGGTLFLFVDGAEAIERVHGFMFRLFGSGFHLPDTFLVKWELTPTLTLGRYISD